MTRKQKHLILHTATLKNTILLAILFFIMSFFIMPDANKQIRLYAVDSQIIDTQLFYCPEGLYEMLDSYGPKGRDLYIVVALTADLIYSIILAAFFCSFLIWSSSKLKAKQLKFEYLLWLPFLSILFNFLENGGIVYLLFNYPQKYFYLAITTSLCTLLKWIIIFTCCGIVGWNTFRLLFLNIHIFKNTQKNIM